MSGSKWRTGLVVSAALLASLLVINLLVDGKLLGGTPAADASECLHFYAADVEQNFFGPAADGNIDQLEAELHERRECDPALVVGHAHAWAMEGFAELKGDEAFVAKTRKLMENRDMWKKTIEDLEERENASKASLATMSGSYETLYMIDRPMDVPLIRRDEPDKPAFKVLRYEYPNGHVVNFKLDCGFQPVGQFPNVPPVGQPPPEPGPTPTTTPTTVPTSSTSTTTTTVQFRCPVIDGVQTVPRPGLDRPPRSNDDCVKPTGVHDTDGAGGDESEAAQPVAENPPDPVVGADADEEPPNDDRPQGDPDGGSGDAGVSDDGPVDDTHEDDHTGPNNDGNDDSSSPPCPFGAGNC